MIHSERFVCYCLRTIRSAKLLISKCAPVMFERKIENTVKFFYCAILFLGDIIISAVSESYHSEIVECYVICFSEPDEKFKFIVFKS